jgi:thiamine pyrophosphate-dependent acetolactate synthase large subunit-like protein
MTGLLGTESRHYALEKTEVVFLRGTDFPYMVWYPKGSKIVQLDMRSEHLGRSSKPDLELMGDVKSTLEALLPQLKQNKRQAFESVPAETARDAKIVGPLRGWRQEQGGPGSQST